MHSPSRLTRRSGLSRVDSNQTRLAGDANNGGFGGWTVASLTAAPFQITRSRPLGLRLQKTLPPPKTANAKSTLPRRSSKATYLAYSCRERASTPG